MKVSSPAMVARKAEADKPVDALTQDEAEA
jgi:hypothetical protein